MSAEATPLIASFSGALGKLHSDLTEPAADWVYQFRAVLHASTEGAAQRAACAEPRRDSRTPGRATGHSGARDRGADARMRSAPRRDHPARRSGIVGGRAEDDVADRSEEVLGTRFEQIPVVVTIV